MNEWEEEENFVVVFSLRPNDSLRRGTKEQPEAVREKKKMKKKIPGIVSHGCALKRRDTTMPKSAAKVFHG